MDGRNLSDPMRLLPCPPTYQSIRMYCIPAATAASRPRAPQAARYQLAFMFLAAAASTLAAASAVRLAARALVDRDHRLRLDLLAQRGDGATGVAGFVHHEVAQVPCCVRATGAAGLAVDQW